MHREQPGHDVVAVGSVRLHADLQPRGCGQRGDRPHQCDVSLVLAHRLASAKVDDAAVAHRGRLLHDQPVALLIRQRLPRSGPLTALLLRLLRERRRHQQDAGPQPQLLHLAPPRRHLGRELRRAERQAEAALVHIGESPGRCNGPQALLPGEPQAVEGRPGRAALGAAAVGVVAARHDHEPGLSFLLL